ncbi:MAG: undecaprenyl/decaprenyl-phosphate alpha-N-acetylglucosaminyl 1-phosphate transferase [Chloroflexia bacterium]|nr:undecaprenyl/decaprenyl-phosphate alpha-N-acetylglucosaminyl 1-phosphate transferase [Chloroflexia bacterium]
MARDLLILVTALGGTFLATPLMRWLALRIGFVDKPSARKIHLQPIPLMGGLAIYLGFILALLFLGLGERRYVRELLTIMIGASLVSFLGAWDDRWGMHPLIKFLGQGLAAGVLLLGGVRINIFPWAWLNIAVTLLWVAGIANAINFLDNMNGLSAGVSAVAAGFFLLLAVNSGQYLVSTMAAALLGACLGFLRYNFGTATIFMGDAGSLLLGFVLAVLGIKLRFPAPLFPANADAITWLIPLLVLGVPIFDTTLVTLSRLRRRVNPATTPGKDHLSHRLVLSGMGQREAVLTLYVLGFISGMLAVLTATLVLRADGGRLTSDAIATGYGIAAAVLLVALWALVHLERIWARAQNPPSAPTPRGPRGSGPDESPSADGDR